MGESIVIPAPVGAGKTRLLEEFPYARAVSISKKIQNEAYTTALNKLGLRHVMPGEGSRKTTCDRREEHPPAEAAEKTDSGETRRDYGCGPSLSSTHRGWLVEHDGGLSAKISARVAVPVAGPDAWSG